MKRKILLVILFGLLSAISLSICDKELPKNSTKKQETNSEVYQSSETETFIEHFDEERVKANQLLEEALKLLDESTIKVNVRNAYSLLEESAKLNNLRAKEMIAKSYLFGDHLPLDVKKALHYLQDIPSNKSSQAHLFLGFMHSIGLGVDMNEEQSLFHYQLAAQLNNPLAKIVIAFRYNHGLGVQKSCIKALELYQSVATDVVEDSKDFGGKPVFGQYLWLKKETWNLNLNMDRDLLDYYKFLAKGGDTKAKVSLGQLYYYGGNGVQRNLKEALHYFQEASKSGNANALAFLGKFHLEDNPLIEQNYTKAFQLFAESAEKNNPIGLTELGLMYRYGKGVEIDSEKAFKYFAQSSRQGWAEAILQVGTMYLYGLGVARDYKRAVKYLTLASHSNHLLAIYNLGQLQASGAGVMRSCPGALSLLKSVAERGIWSEMLTEAYNHYEKGLIVEAFMKFVFLSELGYELAQSNTAFIVENNDISALKSYLQIGPALALSYWKASGMQGSSFSRIKVGDYHYYGLGTPVDYKLAALHYRRASERKYSAQALFNLGYLSEKGLGVDKNLNMAKIYYDMSAQVESDAKVPVFLVKSKLNAMEMRGKFVEWFDLRQYFGNKWDFVLIAVLCLVLAIILGLKSLLVSLQMNANI